MKKLIILFTIICLPVVLMGQTTIKNNFVIERSSPSLHLKGSNGVINFNSGDITLTNTSNTLTIVGGVLALPANGLLINSINHLYGLTDTITDLYYTKANITTYLAGKQDTGVISMTYPASGIALSTGSAWGTSIVNNSANWNTAYGWGNHASAGYALSSALSGYVPTSRTINSRDLTSNISITASDVGLGNVTNESKATMFTNPTFTGVQKVSTTDTLATKAYARSVGGGIGGGISPYSDTMSVSAGVLRTKVTTITTEPYSVQIFSSGGKDITHAVADSVALDGGVYKLYVYSVDALSGCKLKILY
jgi:hypothetical protein